MSDVISIFHRKLKGYIIRTQTKMKHIDIKMNKIKIFTFGETGNCDFLSWIASEFIVFNLNRLMINKLLIAQSTQGTN